ncbi:MAG: DUF2318 domain-containing protein [Rectinemataceae bacterium]
MRRNSGLSFPARFIIAALFLIFTASSGFSQAAAPAKGDWAIRIVKKDISVIAKFYPYTVNGKKMEIFAVKASDGTIRTALNTCQVCYGSGRGYYKQINSILECQNCGNRFKLDQIEKIKGGCNPIPILPESKTDLGDSIGISDAYLKSVAKYFAFWKK